MCAIISQLFCLLNINNWLYMVVELKHMLLRGGPFDTQGGGGFVNF